MEEPVNSASLSPSDSRKWIIRIVLALVLGQAIWGLVVALTASLLMPLTARVMGGDPSSPLYLGKGDIDVPALFIAVIEFCIAGIVAAVLNSWLQRPATVARRKAVAAGSLSLQAAAPAAVPKPVAAAVPAPVPAAPAAKPVTPASPPPLPTPVTAPAVAAKPAPPPPPPAPPAKPAKPKEVYYNIVGDPITMDDD